MSVWRFWRVVAVAGVVVVAFAARPASALVFLTSAAQTTGTGAGQSFLDGEASLSVTFNNGSTGGCSGSLLAGGQYVLTAGHCVTGGNDTLSATSISVNFANVGLTVVTASYVVDPVWNGSLANGGDLALLKLSTPVTTIAGYQLDTTASAVGQVVTLAGYGNTGIGGNGYTPGSSGTLYYGLNTYLGLSADAPTDYLFQYTADGGGVGSQEVMLAPGDSGGASLLNVNGTWQIVGVHDFGACTTTGCVFNSSFGQYGGDTSVFADQGWLDSVIDAPEPGAIALLSVGLLGLAVVRSRGSVPRPARRDQPA
jgi:Trypsin